MRTPEEKALLAEVEKLKQERSTSLLAMRAVVRDYRAGTTNPYNQETEWLKHQMWVVLASCLPKEPSEK